MKKEKNNNTIGSMQSTIKVYNWRRLLCYNIHLSLQFTTEDVANMKHKKY